VSKRVADGMAMNVIPLFASDWGIGITGYAAPVPELKIAERFAYFCISFRGQCILTQKITSTADNPTTAQIGFVNVVLKYFANHLSDNTHI
jgi:nicotinamide-nucleotide amidase